MPPDLAQIAAPFRDRTRHHRTGILVVPALPSSWIEAMRTSLPADLVSWPTQVVANLRPGQSWVRMDVETVLEGLRRLARESAPYEVRLVEGLDFALARWERAQVREFWQEFVVLDRNAPRALIAVLPQSAMVLGPHSEEISILQSDERFIRLDYHG